MPRLPTLLLLALFSLAGAQGLPSIPATVPAPNTAAPAGLKVCRTGDTRLLVDARGTVRALEYARLIPDNRLSVRQSYDRAGRLTGISVRWTGFAGDLLDLRGAYDSRGRLVREVGYREKGVTNALGSYVRAVPKVRGC